MIVQDIVQEYFGVSDFTVAFMHPIGLAVSNFAVDAVIRFGFLARSFMGRASIYSTASGHRKARVPLTTFIPAGQTLKATLASASLDRDEELDMTFRGSRLPGWLVFRLGELLLILLFLFAIAVVAAPLISLVGDR
ncbi:MAG: hypothetical protein ABIL25_01550 [candidate division WOR-3 bacterium]